MHRFLFSRRRGVDSVEVDREQDHYPELQDVIDAALDHEDFPEGPVDRFVVECLGNGQGTWRVWPAKADEPLGGVYTNS